MTVATITDVYAWEALDSRGKPTVGCVVEAGGARGRVIAPSGASTGGHEAAELRDGGSRYAGQGVVRAVANVNGVIRDGILGLDCSDQESVDDALEVLSSAEDLGDIGANAVLAASLSCLLAAADAHETALWEYLGGAHALLPMPMVNIVSGGAHARGLLDIQDVLVVPLGATSFSQAIEWVSRVRACAAELLHERGGFAGLVADEGGLSAALGTNKAALSLVADGIVRAGLKPGHDVSLALDVAANQLWTGDHYELRVENVALTRAEWLSILNDWCNQFPIASLEDVLMEDDWEGWQLAAQDHNDKRQLLGDDLFATNHARLEKGQSLDAANAVLIKPNQAGTISRTLSVVQSAQEGAYGRVVSARSGDTEDYWLADLAVGLKTQQIKVGSTMRSERTAKWNRLLELEARLGERAEFAGDAAFARFRS